MRADILMLSLKMFFTFQFVDCKPTEWGNTNSPCLVRDHSLQPAEPRHDVGVAGCRHPTIPPSLLPHREGLIVIEIVSSQLWKETEEDHYKWSIK